MQQTQQSAGAHSTVTAALLTGRQQPFSSGARQTGILNRLVHQMKDICRLVQEKICLVCLCFFCGFKYYSHSCTSFPQLHQIIRRGNVGQSRFSCRGFSCTVVHQTRSLIRIIIPDFRSIKTQLCVNLVPGLVHLYHG